MGGCHRSPPPPKQPKVDIGKVDIWIIHFYAVNVNAPKITGQTAHYLDNLANKSDRISLTKEAAQSIINNNKLVLYQTDRKTLKFLSENGYVILNLDNEIVTAVPEKLRKKYRTYLGED